MSNVKISALPSAAAITGAELIPVVQSNVTVQATVDNLKTILAPVASPTFTGTVKTATTISVGGATPSASGAGITFPATQSASSDANTLDDYEEGTWTPTITFGATSGSGTGVTYGYQSGTYTKIGRAVVCVGEVVLSNKGSSTGNARITGFPFTNGAGRGSITYGNVNGMSSTGFINSFIEGNAAYSNSYGTNTSGTQTAITNAEFTNTTHLQFTVTFQV
jgi:hypothetical protein